MRGLSQRPFLAALAVLVLLAGCGQQSIGIPVELSGFIDVMKEQGLDGTLTIREPRNEDIEYIAEYAIAKYASTRIISLVRFTDADKAAAGLQDALQNDKLTGQAANASFVMVATFYPPDAEAVEKIKALFLAHDFDR